MLMELGGSESRHERESLCEAFHCLDSELKRTAKFPCVNSHVLVAVVLETLEISKYAVVSSFVLFAGADLFVLNSFDTPQSDKLETRVAPSPIHNTAWSSQLCRKQLNQYATQWHKHRIHQVCSVSTDNDSKVRHAHSLFEKSPFIFKHFKLIAIRLCCESHNTQHAAGAIELPVLVSARNKGDLSGRRRADQPRQNSGEINAS
mmetsp:Transcript_31306/g.76693  ORF Transcript_31306/g.76693 Transcript_31306/m.76693 type:complete len:204 (-) Transcript_31306:852-1463(-)